MSRSYRKPAFSWVYASVSELRGWKRRYNRRMRRKANHILSRTHWSDLDAQEFPSKEADAPVWSGPRDGKQRLLTYSPGDKPWVKEMMEKLSRK